MLYPLALFPHCLFSLPLQDTDFAMAVRAAGLRVLLQPLAVVHHQEGGTFGTDATSDLKRRLMDQNRERFQHKWESALQARGVVVVRVVASARHSTALA